MPYFSQTSRERLETCVPILQEICFRAIQYIDFTVICGHRGAAAQEEAFRSLKSKVRWPNSKHNLSPSWAVDVAPWPLDWGNIKRFELLSRAILFEAATLGQRVVWGGFWGWDIGHYELRDPLIEGGDDWISS